MKKTLYVFVSTCSYDAGKISIWDSDVRDYITDKAFLCTQEVEIDIPEFDIVSLQIDGIGKKIAQIRAEAQVQVNDLEQRKQELLAIGVDEDE